MACPVASCKPLYKRDLHSRSRQQPWIRQVGIVQMNEATSKDRIHVLIIGAGVGGLLLAQGLKKHGVSFDVFEAEQSATVYRAREWGMSIQWALPLLADLLPEDVHSRLQSASVDPHYVFPDAGNAMPVYNAATGEHLKAIPLVKMLRVSRQKFRALLTEGIDVQYNKSFRSLRTPEDGPAVTAQFADGSSATGALIIGADGANFIVRDAVFAAGEGQAQHIPYGGWNMHVCYNDAETALAIRKALSPIVAIGVHPKGYWLWLSIQDVPDPDKPETWVFQLQWTRHLEDGSDDLSHIGLSQLKAEAAESFGEPFSTAWTKIPEGTALPANKISIWPPLAIPDDIFKGKVVLLGDAAHAMSFHRGQGLNHGIADAAKLVMSLAAVQKGQKASAELAVLEYETEMIKRAGEEVAISKMNTEMMHDWEKMQASPFMQRGGDKHKCSDPLQNSPAERDTSTPQISPYSFPSHTTLASASLRSATDWQQPQPYHPIPLLPHALHIPTIPIQIVRPHLRRNPHNSRPNLAPLPLTPLLKTSNFTHRGSFFSKFSNIPSPFLSTTLAKLKGFGASNLVQLLGPHCWQGYFGEIQCLGFGGEGCDEFVIELDVVDREGLWSGISH